MIRHVFVGPLDSFADELKRFTKTCKIQQLKAVDHQGELWITAIFDEMVSVDDLVAKYNEMVAAGVPEEVRREVLRRMSK